MITYTSDKLIDRFTTIIIVGVGTLIFIAPMWILQASYDDKEKFAVITAFFVVFLGLFSSMTDANRIETLALLLHKSCESRHIFFYHIDSVFCRYSAVLMVLS